MVEIITIDDDDNNSVSKLIVVAYESEMKKLFNPGGEFNDN